MRIEGKLKSLEWFLIGVYLPSIAIYLLRGANSLSEFISTAFYVLLTLVSLIVLLISKSDDDYYHNLGPTNLLGAIITGLVMTALSWGLSVEVFKKPDMLLALSKPVIAPLLEAFQLSVNPVASSVSTLLLSTLLFGLVMAATSEELFKLPFFTAGRERWKNGFKIGKITLPGALIYVGFPVGFWACLHAVQAYSNPIFVIPAAMNGVILFVYLYKTRCLLGAVFSHFLYNAGISVITYINGTANVPYGTPLFPNVFDGAYWQTNAFIIDGLLFAIVVWGFLFFLLPSLKRDK
jgi:hypothetical protein